MNDGDHSVTRIAETKIWNIVANGARLFAISARRQHDDGDVSIGCGKFVAGEVDKANRMSATCGKLGTNERGRKEKRGRQ